jgi:hypothetical protein
MKGCEGQIMPIQISDQTTVNQLTEALGIQEVHAPDGRVLGQFIPARRPGMSFPEFGITDVELDRQLNDPNMKWYTPEEVMERLREIDRCSP